MQFYVEAVYSLIPRAIDSLSPSWPWPSSSFPLFASVGILRPACRPEKPTEGNEGNEESRDRCFGTTIIVHLRYPKFLPLLSVEGRGRILQRKRAASTGVTMM